MKNTPLDVESDLFGEQISTFVYIFFFPGTYAARLTVTRNLLGKTTVRNAIVSMTWVCMVSWLYGCILAIVCSVSCWQMKCVDVLVHFVFLHFRRLVMHICWCACVYCNFCQQNFWCL